MVSIGYALSSEEHTAPDLVRYARRAEEVGFSFALISDHFHPWIDKQGQSPFVWSTLGAIANATERLVVGTGVTCPMIRTHPAIIAQAAATVGQLMPGRFFLGVGSGENLNEHVVGEYWPTTEVRQEMLEEAIEVMRLLWEGELCSHHGDYYAVEQARIYSLPEQPVPIMVAAGGPNAASLAARAGDGLIATSPSEETVNVYREDGGDGPRIGSFALCWAESEEAARKTALEWWPNAAIGGNLGQELRLPSEFEAAAQLVREEDVAEMVPCGPDPAPVLEQIDVYVKAGFDHVFMHQVGPDQEGFFRFFERELAPKLSAAPPQLASVA